ncbi:hypothetical protein [Cyanobium sp. PCC 7001]|uniref:hypothetical protein n=1 Tax=Cyanobium sp. PCC 7001 TaxID=180281 RepID=UPI0012EA5B89|nr:hypothetical protein [Cyanobium sp. PCC 7001]
MQVKTVYLHVGLHKTASSSFQRTCKKNRKRLLRKGLNYPLFACIEKPDVAIRNHSIPLYSAFSDDPASYHMNIKWKIQDLDRVNVNYLNVLDAALDGPGDVLLPGEDISSLSATALRRFSDALTSKGHRLSAIALVRSPYSFHCSALQQMIKAGRSFDFNNTAWITSQRQTLERLLAVFGEAITIHPFSKACSHRRGPVGFLFDQVGVKALHRYSIVEANQSKGNLAVRMQNLINQRYPAILEGRLNESHYRIMSLLNNGQKFLLTSKELASCKEFLLQENAYMGERFGPDYCDQEFPVVDELSAEVVMASMVEVLRPIVNGILRESTPSSPMEGSDSMEDGSG